MRRPSPPQVKAQRERWALRKGSGKADYPNVQITISQHRQAEEWIF